MTRTDLQRRQWHPTPVLLPGKSHGQRSLVGCSPWGRKELDMTEWLTFTFHFHALEKEMATHSCSCLENPRDSGAWWAAVYGVAPSWTRLKRLSSRTDLTNEVQKVTTRTNRTAGAKAWKLLQKQLQAFEYGCGSRFSWRSSRKWNWKNKFRGRSWRVLTGLPRKLKFLL